MTFESSDYNPMLFGAGAAKLAASAVAPLVAAARGYRSFRSVDSRAMLQTARAPKQHARARAWFPVDDADVLLLPWMRANLAREHAGDPTRASYFQARPSHPREVDGKVIKYDSFVGAATPLDVHPAAHAWMTSATKVLLTEGVLKADSALTAQLLEAGVTADDLALPSGFDPDDDIADWQRAASVQLTALLERVPKAKRHLVVAFVGVSNWRSQANSAEWQSLPMRESTVLVAFDGDLRENPNVHRQAVDLFDSVSRKGATPMLLDLGAETALVQARAVGLPGKIGLDDYLASGAGTWADAIGLSTPDLPKAPSTDDERVSEGMVRNSPDGTRVEEYRQAGDRGYWETVDFCAGRVLAITETRTPSVGEMRSGYADPRALSDTQERRVEIEVTFRHAGELRKEIIIGSGRLLEREPEQWATAQERAHVPPLLAASPVWPPSSRMKWVRAMKAASPDVEYRRAWSQQGWVPGDREGDHPVFVIGTQSLGQTPEDERRVTSAVDDSYIGGIERFGVIDRFRDLDADEYAALVRTAIESTVDLYMRRIWDPIRAAGYGPIMLAAMLRPTLPTPWAGALWFTGPPKSGKSLASAFCLRGWSQDPSTWDANRLPAPASSSRRAHEIAQGRAAIWVIDDVQPGEDGQSTEKILDDIVRQQFTGSARRVSTQSSRMRQDPNPRATLIVSSEVALSSASARQRTITLDFVNDMTPGFRMFTSDVFKDGTAEYPAIVTAAMVRHLLSDSARASTWEQKLAHVARVEGLIRDSMQDRFTEEMGMEESVAERQAKLVSGLLVALSFLKLTYISVGGDDAETLKALDWDDDESDVVSVIRLAARSLGVQEGDTIGARLVAGLADALRSGRVHMLGPEPGVPPFSDDDQWRNELVGWRKRNGAWETRGETVGSAGYIKGAPVLLLSRSSAFRAAQSLRDGSVAPGQSLANTWSAAVNAGLVGPNEQRRLGGEGSPRARGYLATFDTFFGTDDDAKE